MKKELISSLLVLLGSLLYAFLFWQEKMGLNTLIFSVFILISLFILRPESWQSQRVFTVAASTFVTAVLVVWHNSLLVKMVHVASFLMLIGFVQRRELRFIWYAMLMALTSILETPWKASREQNLSGTPQPHWKNGIRWAKLVVVPLFLATLFLLIYMQANPAFAKIVSHFWQRVLSLFQFDMEWRRIGLVLIGILLTGGLFWPSANGSIWLGLDQKHPLVLARKRLKRKASSIFGMNGLKKEYWMGPAFPGHAKRFVAHGQSHRSEIYLVGV